MRLRFCWQIKKPHLDLCLVFWTLGQYTTIDEARIFFSQAQAVNTNHVWSWLRLNRKCRTKRCTSTQIKPLVKMLKCSKENNGQANQQINLTLLRLGRIKLHSCHHKRFKVPRVKTLDSSTLACYKCTESHNSQKCPFIKERCYHCGILGHTASNCRKTSALGQMSWRVVTMGTFTMSLTVKIGKIFLWRSTLEVDLWFWSWIQVLLCQLWGKEYIRSTCVMFPWRTPSWSCVPTQVCLWNLWSFTM